MLIEAARTMLIYAKALFFLWTEAVDTACYTQNRSIIRLRHEKTPYELLHDKLPDLSFFHVFGALYYPTNDSENLGKLQQEADIDFDELTAMAFEHRSSGPVLHEMTPAIISLGLVSNPPPSTLFVPPSRTDWDILFHPLFDELLNPPSSVDHPAPEVIALIAEVVAPEPAASTGSPSSKTVDQDAPSHSNSQTTPETQSHVIPNDVKEDNHDLDVAHMNNDPFFGILIPENVFEASSSSDVIPTIVHTATPNSEHVTKWTKDHPLDNIIDELERRVSIRLQLHEQALFSLKKYGMESSDPVDTPMVEKSRLDEDTQGKPTLNSGFANILTGSTSGSMQLLGDRLVSWSSKRKKSAGISSTEAKYIAMILPCWQQYSTFSSSIHQISFIKGEVEKNGVVELYFVNTEYQLADIFTKPLCRERIEFLINKLGMRSFTPETLKQFADEAEE
ncbi:hypothetical protein Tco_0603785 [Tanacetum coccineum]